MLELIPIAIPGLLGVLLGVAAALAKGNALRLAALVVLFGGYSTLLAVWLVAEIAHLFLPIATDNQLSGIAWWYAPFYTLGIIIWALWPPRRLKLWATGIAFAAGIVVFNYTWPLRALSDRLYVERRHEALTSLVADITEYKRIRQFDPVYVRALNGTSFLYPGADTASYLKRVPLDSILARDGIDPTVLADFQNRLADLHLMAFWADSGQVTLARSRDVGLLYRPPNQPPLAPGAPLGNAGRIVRVFAKGWYWYSSAG